MVECLSAMSAAHRCYVPIYCFMPDHLHVMLAGIDERADLLEAMYQFKHRSAMWMVRTKQPFRWQKDFYDHIIRASEDWRAHATYISLNPVRAGIAEDPFDYPFTGSIGTDLQEVILGWW